MKDSALPEQTDLRPPAQVMRLARLGAMFPTRLSFLRVLIRALRAAPERTHWQMDADGYGRAVYTIGLGGHDYSLVALTRPLAPEHRSDRVIATAWDAAFVLYDGRPDAMEIDRIAANAPLQEAGRFTERDLVLSRANKSVRLWAHVVDALRSGRQPDAAEIGRIGYLMRTTAVYGNGKFGIADRGLIAQRPLMGLSFMAEMLTVWLIRHFTLELAEHVGGARLDRPLARHLGIGNSTGLGMAPFLVTHPVLLNNWMMVRETGLARVRALARLDAADGARIAALADRARRHLDDWHVPDAAHEARLDRLRADWRSFAPALEPAALTGDHPLDALCRKAETCSADVQELVVSLLIEAFPDLVDGLAECLTDPFGGCGTPLDGTQALRRTIESRFDWALDTDYTAADACAQFWYVSEEKLEPRLGRRHEEPGADRESPLDIARRVAALHADLPARDMPMATFLAAHPQHLMAVERVQIAAAHPYSEIRDNLIGEGCLPIDLLRAKLAMFGASKFDPKSDLWTRVTLAQGAPLADELGTAQADDWWCPVAPVPPVAAAAPGTGG